jgi:hypothetical protein
LCHPIVLEDVIPDQMSKEIVHNNTG